MAKSSIVIDLDDPRSDAIADVISNKTSKKILNLLIEGEMSSSEISEKLGQPLNTVTYNMKKLVDAGLVDKSGKMFWSSKGKKMEIYRLSNRKIVISPRKIVRGVLPTIFVTLIIAALIGVMQLQSMQNAQVQSLQMERNEKYSADGSNNSGLMQDSGVSDSNNAAAGTSAAGTASAETQPTDTTSTPSEKEFAPWAEDQGYQRVAEMPDAWAWYLIGALSALVVLVLWNLRKNE